MPSSNTSSLPSSLRTGLVILLLLASLGVDPGAIAEDYILSDSAYADLSDEKAMVGALEQVRLFFYPSLPPPQFVSLLDKIK